MAIRILSETDVTLTQSEAERFRRDYDAMCSYMVGPPNFETYCRQRKAISETMRIKGEECDE